MTREIWIETSWFDPDRVEYNYGGDYWMRPVVVSYPEHLDSLTDSELLDLADERNTAVSYEMGKKRGEIWGTKQ